MVSRSPQCSHRCPPRRTVPHTLGSLPFFHRCVSPVGQCLTVLGQVHSFQGYEDLIGLIPLFPYVRPISHQIVSHISHQIVSHISHQIVSHISHQIVSHILGSSHHSREGYLLLRHVTVFQSITRFRVPPF